MNRLKTRADSLAVRATPTVSLSPEVHRATLRLINVSPIYELIFGHPMVCNVTQRRACCRSADR